MKFLLKNGKRIVITGFLALIVVFVFTNLSMQKISAVGPIVTDTFSRTSSGEWGVSDSGATYALLPGSGSASDFNVNGSAGTINIANPDLAYEHSALVNGISTQDVDMKATFQVNKLLTGSFGYVELVSRSAAGKEYRGRLELATSGNLHAQAFSVLNNTKTALGTKASGLLSYPNSLVNVRMQVTGSTPTTIKIKAWPSTQVEPSAYQYTATDSTGPQVAGSVGFRAGLQSAVTGAPYVFSFDNFTVDNFGGTVITATPTATPSCFDIPGTLGSAQASVYIPVSNNYIVWSRMFSPDTTNNSYYLQIDNQCPIKVNDDPTSPFNSWIWTKSAQLTADKQVSFSLTAGNHIVKLIGTEPGVGLDKLLFVTDSCVPDGMGANCSSAPTLTLAPTATATPVPPTSTVAPTPVPTTTVPTPTSVAGAVTLGTLADAYVDRGNATKNNGTATTLQVYGTGNVAQAITYMKFNLSTLAGKTIKSAKLRLYVTNSSANPQYIRQVADTTWGEGTINYNNRPLVSTVVATINAPQTSKYFEFDITSYAQAKVGQSMSVAIDETTSDSLWFSSKEATVAQRPQLVISY